MRLITRLGTLAEVTNQLDTFCMLYQSSLCSCFRGRGIGLADPAAAGPIIYSEITTKDEHHNLTEEL